MAIAVLAVTNVLALVFAAVALERRGPRGAPGPAGIPGTAGSRGPEGKPGKRGAAAPAPGPRFVIPADSALRQQVDSLDQRVQTLCQQGLVDGYAPANNPGFTTLHQFYC